MLRGNSGEYGSMSVIARVIRDIVTSRRYVALTQPPWCCVPTCLLMVLQRRNLPLLQIEEIGVELGLAVPVDCRELYPSARIGVRPSSGYGTEIQNPLYSLNAFFQRREIPLREDFILSPPDDFSQWLKSQLESDRDLLVCFNHKSLFGGDADWGHVCLVNSVESSSITLVDPSPNDPKFREVSAELLVGAINSHGPKNRGGIWVVESTSA